MLNLTYSNMKLILILTCVSVAIFAVHIFYFGYYRYPQVDFKEQVRNDIYGLLLRESKKSSNFLSFVKENNRPSNPVQNYSPDHIYFDGFYIFSESSFVQNPEGEYVIEEKMFISNNKLDWSDGSIYFDKTCSEMFVFKSKLYCYSSNSNKSNIQIFSKIGKVEKEIQIPLQYFSSLKIQEYPNILWSIWPDTRARWYNSNAFTIGGDYSGDIMTGPWLIMAGRLNLDTLEFEEYVIKYDSDVFP